MARIYWTLFATVSKLCKGNGGTALALISVAETTFLFSIYAIADPAGAAAISHSGHTRLVISSGIVAAVLLNSIFLETQKHRAPNSREYVNYDYLTIFFLPVILAFICALRAAP